MGEEPLKSDDYDEAIREINRSGLRWLMAEPERPAARGPRVGPVCDSVAGVPAVPPEADTVPPTPRIGRPPVASIDEVIASISANSDAVTEIQARVEGSKAMAEETMGQLQALNVEGAAAAVGACKDQLEECSAMAAALANKLIEARAAAEAAKHA